jgi:spoIIIJ-associated protein
MSEENRLEEIRSYVGMFVKAAQLQVAAQVRIEEDAFVIDLSGPDEGLLLDRRGELLESVQFILGKVLQKRFGSETRFLVDSANFRRGREREITEIAQRSAERVRKHGEPFELSPMNPYERRIVHLALKDVLGVRTESVGDGFLKRVTIFPSHGDIK